VVRGAKKKGGWDANEGITWEKEKKKLPKGDKGGGFPGSKKKIVSEEKGDSSETENKKKSPENPLKNGGGGRRGGKRGERPPFKKVKKWRTEHPMKKGKKNTSN